MENIQITLTSNSNLFFTSDLHLNHRNILEFCHRPFSSVKEMNQTLMDNWNEMVREEDKIFCLGDFDWFPSRHAIKKTIGRLHGEIYMLGGNHDNREMFSLCLDNEKFHLCEDIVHLYIRDELDRLPRKVVEIVCCHYPLATWSHVRNSIQCFGHIHSKSIGDYVEFSEALNLRSNQIDVGVDANHYRPIDIFEVIELTKISQEN